jgi:hypothetical protein
MKTSAFISVAFLAAVVLFLTECTGPRPRSSINPGGKMTQETGNGRPYFDEDQANSYIGKYVLIGLSYEDEKGNPQPEKQTELHGRIESADATDGFRVRLEGKRAGETYWLPPDLRAFKEGRPGEYRLRNTGEVMKDPDLIAEWIVAQHEKKE